VDQLFARLKESGHFAWLNTESITKELHWHEEMIKVQAEGWYHRLIKAMEQSLQTL
jgi:hypothetical protein